MQGSDKDFAEVARLRAARREAIAAAERGDLARVLRAAADEPCSSVYVVKLLDVQPGLGKVAGRRLLERLGLDPFTRVIDLSPDHADEILRECDGPR